MKPVVVGIGGSIGAGKTALARAVADRLGVSCGSFGEVVRDEALARGIPQERSALANLGQTMLEGDAGGLCRKALELVNWDGSDTVVLEGFRHTQALAEVRRAVHPSRVFLIWLSGSLDLRRARVRARSGVAAADGLERADAHSSESQGAVLEAAADLVLDADEPVPGLLEKVFSALQGHAAHGVD